MLTPARILALLALAAAPAFAQQSQPTTAPTTAPYKLPLITSATLGLTTTNVYKPLDTRAITGAIITHDPIRVIPITDDARAALKIDPYYKKMLTIRGIPITASQRVSDYALLECAYVVDHMLKDSPLWVTDALANRCQLAIIASTEFTMDMPSNQIPENLTPTAAAFQDRRSRGLGDLAFATCAEENLLNLASDPYRLENITLHEFSHTIAAHLEVANPEWGKRWNAAYKNAMDKHLYDNTYAGGDYQEYWAEGAQAWFDCARQNDKSVHSGIWNRDQMKEYDPPKAALLKEVYGDGPWRYVKSNPDATVIVGDITYKRPPEELLHLAGLDRTQIPPFNINNSPRIQAAPPTTRPRGRGQRGTTTQPATQPASQPSK